MLKMIVRKLRYLCAAGGDAANDEVEVAKVGESFRAKVGFAAVAEVHDILQRNQVRDLRGCMESEQDSKLLLSLECVRLSP